MRCCAAQKSAWAIIALPILAPKKPFESVPLPWSGPSAPGWLGSTRGTLSCSAPSWTRQRAARRSGRRAPSQRSIYGAHRPHQSRRRSWWWWGENPRGRVVWIRASVGPRTLGIERAFLAWEWAREQRLRWRRPLCLLRLLLAGFISVKSRRTRCASRGPWDRAHHDHDDAQNMTQGIINEELQRRLDTNKRELEEQQILEAHLRALQKEQEGKESQWLSRWHAALSVLAPFTTYIIGQSGIVRL